MKSGYKGHDQMRENAEKAFGKQLKLVRKKDKMSASEVDKLKPRLYAKGGHVGGKTEYKMAAEAGSSRGHMKKGGMTKKCADGGMIRGVPIRSPGIGGMKKGGKVRAKKMAMGGDIGGQMGALPIAQAAPSQTSAAMKKGGKVRAKKMAMGGVGKMRLHQESKSGKQMKPKRHRGV